MLTPDPFATPAGVAEFPLPLAAASPPKPEPLRVIPGALLLVDLSAVFWWKWHAAAGERIDAAYEYAVDKVLALADDYERVAICCDSGRSFRYDIDPEYKANRPPRDEAAVAQIRRVERELRDRGFPVWSVPNFEGDDVIATAVRLAAERNPAERVVIAGSDKDLFQLVGPNVWMLSLLPGVLLDAAGVADKIGVPPEQVRDYLALVGDTSDNVRGVAGIGPKRAAGLLRQFPTVAAVLQALEEKDPNDKPLVQPDSVRAALVMHREVLELAVQLVSLRTDAPIPDFDAIDRPRVAKPMREQLDDLGPDEGVEAAITIPTSPAGEAARAAGAEQAQNETPTPPKSEAMQSNGTAANANGTTNHLGNPPAASAPVTRIAPASAPASRFGAAAVTTAPDVSAHRFILTGRSGAGKTFLASTIPDVFMIPIEEGLKGVSPAHNPAHYKNTPRNLRELHEALDGFAKDVNRAPEGGGRRPYRYLVLDSLTGIETLVHAQVCDSERVAHMEAKEYKKVWHAAEPEWDRLLQRLDWIRRTGTHVMLIAHSSEIVDASSTSGEIYRKWDLALKGSGDVGAAMRNKIRGWADHVFFLDWVTTVLAGGKGKRSVGRYEGRILYTRESATHYAKTRSPLPASLPATWQDIARALASGQAAPDAKLRSQIEDVANKLPPEDRAAILAELGQAQPAVLAAILSRAQGMLAIARDDLAAIEDEAVDAPIGDEQFQGT